MNARRAALAAVALAACVARGAQAPTPVPPAGAADPPEAFVREEAQRARAVLDAIPGRAALRERIRTLTGSSTMIRMLRMEAGRVFYLKSAPGLQEPVLCVREGFTGTERVLVDPRQRPDGGENAVIDWFVPSPDGRHVAFGMSRGAESLLHVVGVDDGRDLPFEIDRTRMNRHLAWERDGRSFYYTRVPEGESGARRAANARIYRHVLGRETARDEVVFAPGVGGARDIPEAVEPWIVVPRESRHAYAIARSLPGGDIAVHVTLARDLEAGRPRWHKLAGAADEILAIAAWKNELYLLSRRDAPRHRVLRVSAGAESLAGARVAAAEGDAVIRSMALARDALYLRTMVAGVDRLERVRLGLLGPGSREFLRIPFDTAIAQLLADPARAGAVLRLEGWVQPPSILQVDARTGDVRNTGLQPPPAADFSAIDEVRLYAPARDGAKIPITLLYRKTTRLTSDNPTLLVGYGAFGDPASPRYDPARLAWLERGGVFAVAHVRGGGEYGDPWHAAGSGGSKATTILDFIAACEFLERYGFTNQNRLAVEATGAGGIAVAGALVRRPDLFAALVAREPVVDLASLARSPRGRAELAEFGSDATEEDRARLRAISPYEQVSPGMPYPGVLFAIGTDDRDADPSQAARMAARLQQATTSGKPVLLRVDFGAGDLESAPRAQRVEMLADIYAFALWQLGDPAFQPGPPVPPAALPRAPRVPAAE